eukprot:CAMPEP_0174332278 /NCGR_PEP_ID=MMETSP0810-20121108/18173_1 /TAXON_ID=73025 ORGANISM="Eutreptiella gymnastica-like, Strain CCMP1594" /NCGR_SAMPLE_ID=MMETSP0810 /ASSEMBLY_ACC=CAM_ASM_000659 /LENGTH=220 /DNA_ID=CAMNT_0015448597 /DNA_START=61 /DNA_END=720 /DNA_ORIENTATION=-
MTLCKTLKLRFRVAATACVYFKRFYLHQSMVTECDPELMVPTTVLLASKVENMHDVNGETVVREYVSRHFHYRVEQVMEAEYYLLQALEFHTVVFHPFKPMENCLESCEAFGVKVAPFADTAWSMLNDSYFTGVSLVYPPSKIALGCLVMGAMMAQADISDFLATLGAEHLSNLDAISKDLIAAYQLKAAIVPATLEEMVDKLHNLIIERRRDRQSEGPK